MQKKHDNMSLISTHLKSKDHSLFSFLLTLFSVFHAVCGVIDPDGLIEGSIFEFTYNIQVLLVV